MKTENKVMEIFESSHLSREGKRRIIGSLASPTGKQMYRVADEKGKEQALEIVNITWSVESIGVPADVLRQAHALTIRHPNLEAIQDMDIVFVCHDFARPSCQEAHVLWLSELQYENLRTWMEKDQREAPAQDTIRMIHDILQGLAYLHSHDLVHNELHPGNVLCDEKNQAKLSDWSGLYVVGTPLHKHALHRSWNILPYLAPEHLTEASIPVSFGTDIWAFGILLYEILVGPGKTPFFDESKNSHWLWDWFRGKSRRIQFIQQAQLSQLGPPDYVCQTEFLPDETFETSSMKHPPLLKVLHKLAKNLHFLPQKDLSDCIHMISQCLQWHPDKRPSAKQLLTNPVFRRHGFRPHVTRSCLTKYPPVHALPRGPYRQIRANLIETCVNDIQYGHLAFYPTVLALSFLDRVFPFFDFDNEKKETVNITLFYELYGACYLIATKLITDTDPGSLEAILNQTRGLVGSSNELVKWSVLSLERMVLDYLRFRFFIERVTLIPIDIRVFRVWMNQPVRLEKK